MLFPLISSKIHGILDYISAVCLIVHPFLVGWNTSQQIFWVTPTLGIIVILYSLVTRYEAGVAGLLSFRAHLLMDILVAIVLLVASFYYRSNANSVNEVLFYSGLVIIAVPLLSNPHANYAKGPLLSPNSPAPPPENVNGENPTS